MTTAMHWTEKLLNEGLRIMYYSGNLDFIIAYPLSENAYQHMRWNGSEKYRSARRESLIVNSKMAGLGNGGFFPLINSCTYECYFSV